MEIELEVVRIEERLRSVGLFDDAIRERQHHDTWPATTRAPHHLANQQRASAIHGRKHQDDRQHGDRKVSKQKLGDQRRQEKQADRRENTLLRNQRGFIHRVASIGGSLPSMAITFQTKAVAGRRLLRLGRQRRHVLALPHLGHSAVVHLDLGWLTGDEHPAGNLAFCRYPQAFGSGPVFRAHGHRDFSFGIAVVGNIQRDQPLALGGRRWWERLR